MRIALVGYGKMGKAIERIACAQGHEIVLKISAHNKEDLTAENLTGVDVAIEFTQPESAFDNVCKCLQAGVAVVSGTTGWNEMTAEAGQMALTHHTAFLHASNFSLGVNLFFAINDSVAALMQRYPLYDVRLEEIHHTAKKDAPSGTAITIAEHILRQFPEKRKWVLGNTEKKEELSIAAKRVDEVPGTHTVSYESGIDSIELTHTAHNRDGFAQGAVLAAAFVSGKRGVFTMKDVLGL